MLCAMAMFATLELIRHNMVKFELGENSPKQEKTEVQEKIFSAQEYFDKIKETGSEKHIKAYEKVLELSRAVEEAGGTALLVGGSVRDMFLGKISKDFDVEVYGIMPDILKEMVQKLGKLSEVGESFSVLKLSFGEGIDIDVSLPRTDSKIGEGHRDFEIKYDPSMSVSEAARRRDFTINSMAFNPLTGEFYDPYGGLKDLRERILRVTDEEKFKEDSLRVMRALQFIGRFGLSLEPKSLRIVQETIPALKKLSKERIAEEWKKLLLKSEKPSAGLVAGMTLGVFAEIHPELLPLIESSKEFYAQGNGDVWNHTLMTVDKAAEIIRREELEENNALAVMLAVLAHEFGKPAVTKIENGQLISIGYEEVGMPKVEKFLADMGVDRVVANKLISGKVSKLVRYQNVPASFYVSEKIMGETVKDGMIRELASEISPATILELVLVAEANTSGRENFPDNEAGKWLLSRARKLGVETSRPPKLITGKDLLALGLKGSPDIGKIIGLADNLRDQRDITRELFFRAIYGIKDSKEIIARLEGLLNGEDI